MADRVEKSKKSQKSKKLDTVFVVPAPNQFMAAVAEELLRFKTPSELISLIQRSEGSGPWSEKIEISKKFKNKNGKYQYKNVSVSKYERELGILQRAKKANVMLSDNDDYRREELLKLNSLANKSDQELEHIIKNWIEKTRMDRSLPEPLPKDFIDAYELSFQPRISKSDS